MIKVRKCRNQESYSIKDVSLPFTFTIYISSREKAEEIKKNWLQDSYDSIIIHNKLDTRRESSPNSE